MTSTLKDLCDATQSALFSAAACADSTARHINLYRAVSYRVAADLEDGRKHHYRHRFANDVMGEFDAYDQDKKRAGLERKMQLAKCGEPTAQDVNLTLEFAQQKKTNNLALLHQVARTRRIIFGDKNVIESLSYARRASRGLHPDRNADLIGWSIPGVAYHKDLGPEYRYEHAKTGAAALFAIHNNLKTLLSDPHYQRLLYSRRVLRGGQLTIPQLASDLTVATIVGLAVCLVRKKPVALLLKTSAIAYAVLLLLYGGKAVVQYRAQQKQVKCRELVLYRPADPSFAQGAM